jgi:hypothetical protein
MTTRAMASMHKDVVLPERFARNISVTLELEEVGNIYPDVTSLE